MGTITELLEGQYKKPKKFKEVFLDKDPQMGDSIAAQLTPLQLKINIDKRDKYIDELEKILSNKSKLKKIISSKEEMNKLQTALDKLHKKEIIPDFEKEIVNKIPDNKTLNNYFGITPGGLNKMLKIDRLEAIGKGVTTIVFKHPKNKKKVISITTDTKKLDWMEANKDLFDYQYITEIDYERGNKAHVFTMKKINKFFERRDLSAAKMNLIHSEVVVPYFYLVNKKSFDAVAVSDIDWIIEYMSDKELIDILKKVQKVYKSTDSIDLHGGQWGEDEQGRILLFDPVIDNRVFDKTGTPNIMSWKGAIKNFASKMFGSDSEKKERESIIKLLMRK